MKALMLKDFYVLKRQMWLVVLVIVLFQIAPNTSGMLISVLYAVLLPASAFAYDDRSKWDAMALMLPYSTKQIVLSRYCVGWLSALVFLPLGSVARWIFSALARRLSVSTEMWGAWDVRILCTELALAFCFLAISMPVYFRFDAERSRVIRMLIIFVIAAVAGGAIALTASRDIPLDFSGGWGLFFATAVLTGVSIPLSMFAWQRRHR